MKNRKFTGLSWSPF